MTYRVYCPRNYEHCNGGADADANGDPINLESFYIEYEDDETGEAGLISGPYPTPGIARKQIDEAIEAAQ